MERTTNSSPWTTRLLMVGMVVPPILFLGSMPWLRTLDTNLALLLAGIASVSVLVSSLALGIIKDQEAEEWERTSARFSGQWGYVVGGTFLAFLLNLPPFRNWVTSIASSLTNGATNDLHVILAFTAGFLACIIAQMIAILLIRLGWRAWMSRSR